MPDRLHVVVHPVAPGGGRAVVAHVHGEDRPLGMAHSLADVVEMFRAAGLETAVGWPPIRWLGGAPDEWGED
ncbi:hypothetical protein ACFZBM_21810 [Streptomyces lavendulae]|uniref:hypothetical protein n=1 Tax=Streptomyces lavendulae TaxID=1914 RepID=UPI0004BE9235|nr:hypothetical protein [Streptomyces lavendulae]GLW01619.1 hypothetical protein Slala05_52500 [Streptomyces lavendulae subsp. lavendulae]